MHIEIAMTISISLAFFQYKTMKIPWNKRDFCDEKASNWKWWSKIFLNYWNESYTLDVWIDHYIIILENNW